MGGTKDILTTKKNPLYQDYFSKQTNKESCKDTDSLIQSATRINGYSYTHGKLCLVQRLTLCKSGKANNPFFPSFPANKETWSAATPSETRNLNESFLKKRQSSKPRREKACYYGAPLTN
ncbi:hypothetical protein CDAR_281411 [Caerostris darwini]|uniref:Uncharacterized protein n=1 Tax=Caerostris darwini TaxID=1538125 RepID=A0AAV4THN8_9ARAC|nr:hypothetical protein CDAR_281411 [Caerostris darwini]